MSVTSFKLWSQPHKRLDLQALRANLRGYPPGVIDLRFDAYGHGADVIAPTLDSHTALVDSEAEAERLRKLSVDVTTTRTATISPAQLFGIPSDQSHGATPVMALIGQILAIKPLRAGESVSYGHHFTAHVATRIALVSGGYAQGVVRALGNRVSVEVNGRLHPLIGRVAMDVCVIEVGGSQPAIGDEVTYFGGRGPARFQLAEWARATGLTPEELLVVAAQRAPYDAKASA